MTPPIPSARFYGNSLDKLYEEFDKKIEESRKRRSAVLDDLERPRSIFRPAPYKEEFWKQHDALVDAAERSDGDDILCCFVFQDESGKRRFIVTYPEDFWTESEHVPAERRVFYEVIPENTPCFLYYDLEYETEINKDKNGVRMTRTLIDITCAYIKQHWNYVCDRTMVINLDSSRPGKFSKHLTFSTKDVAFENNFHVGHLIKLICADLATFVDSDQETQHEILSKFDKKDLQELFVETDKGKKLFIDVNVYTKNRHFRVYKATKYGKNSHLIHAPDCEYIWENKSNNKEMEIFLKSMISYLPKKKRMKLLSFDEDKKAQLQTYSQYSQNNMARSFICKEYPKSPYPCLDKFVSDHVKPGKIRDSKFNEKQRAILFEVMGNRYCENIGRQHKSNNVYYIVDLIGKVMFQKCHDEDCSHFISKPIKIPPEVTFYFDDETDSLLSALEET
ncbi:DNA-directed primase/polymerase protein-like [Trichogramma pretiosum]|uniref:DNA-directed primase/polymerase protein-like n=1 Tax=Trichogramma pretiosum TaxID=7493 RepID=UPI0006C95082|nr:DNA-directed primase/polymerase protein-like [Trichogramma pretiosum]